MELIKRGDIYLADLGDSKGGIIGGMRPVLVIQNNIVNKFSPTVLVVPLASNSKNRKLPIHVVITKSFGLSLDSIILLEQIKAISKTKIKEKLGHASSEIMVEVEKAMNLVTSQSKIDSKNSSMYKEFYSVKLDLIEIKDILKNSNYIGNKIKDWIFSGIIGTAIGIIIGKIIS
ncbi:type II toxin-antitoxin system PemK/MazF family toxin [Clostridium cochlearium]|uniref:type II toxin-antitoxin system PemK/MazF family toxin n=1 Tax=Clostridium cochlearium TaxID=1494 RepID=UPI001C0EA2A7|nr:type II toxin-antitoxin system PemK/MazF family toxin [Clostridium cochlearium]MBU5269478.1 type II toxin-antitoxin system PemK/MazF family toxin [Clostridium cochlearium]